MTRNEAIPVLRRLIVAPVTRTVRDIPTEIPLGRDEGLPDRCAASFDDLQPVDRGMLTTRVGALAGERRREICQTIAALADC
jgi:mRNA interferase MazF